MRLKAEISKGVFGLKEPRERILIRIFPDPDKSLNVNFFLDDDHIDITGPVESLQGEGITSLSDAIIIAGKILAKSSNKE